MPFALLIQLYVSQYGIVILEGVQIVMNLAWKG